ncbi:DUF6163 family protein [Chelatococcus sp. SYSU_G07232]|uniref:DUF6163 family protein n=1 Tax=Chelatococcus albus TaxID=3047466 RepID=A0ABT7ADR6_9HYPH|nr:DUF6163 family protein [Chelatococcus sp. SYSU_G07232]MDJ1156939.1 DUF6163 family protein [Chelatococcus sp. SYSU_G07232]
MMKPGDAPGATRGVLEAMRTGGVDRGFRWDRALVWFLRVMALVWVAKGLGAWAALLGIGPDGAMPFEGRPLSVQATVIYFAVIDLVAAVGLWLTSTWGGVMWLLAVMSHLIMAVFFPRIIDSGLPTTGALIVLVAAYLGISWLAAREDE